MAKDLIAKENKNAQIEDFFPFNPDSSRITLSCRRADYSASLIARAVEDADASLINLNVTSRETSDGCLIVDLRIDHRNPAGVIRSLERYGFGVVGADLPEANDSTLRRRYEELMKMLSIGQ